MSRYHLKRVTTHTFFFRRAKVQIFCMKEMAHHTSTPCFLISLVYPDCDVQENALVHWRKHCPTRARRCNPTSFHLRLRSPLACIITGRALQLDGSGSFGLRCTFPRFFPSYGKASFSYPNAAHALPAESFVNHIIQHTVSDARITSAENIFVAG